MKCALNIFAFASLSFPSLLLAFLISICDATNDTSVVYHPPCNGEFGRKLQLKNLDQRLIKLNDDLIERICAPAANAVIDLDLVTLEFCDEFTLPWYLNASERIMIKQLRGESELTDKCRSLLKNFNKLDLDIHLAYRDFTKVLDHFDCASDMIENTCQQCSMAYKRWICSANFSPYEYSGRAEDDSDRVGSIKLKPCVRYCETVAEYCPILIPEDLQNPDMSGSRSEYVFQCPTATGTDTDTEIYAATLECYLPCEDI